MAESARLRFRPILRTSFAFILGVLPLVWATGAAATVLAEYLVPVFHVAVQGLIELLNGPPQPIPATGASHSDASGHGLPSGPSHAVTVPEQPAPRPEAGPDGQPESKADGTAVQAKEG